ncbi:MAG: hypothetical protein AAF655_03315 [Bacteroidota bacterium]
MHSSDTAVHIGGLQVYPEMVEGQITQIGGVKKCWIRKMRPEEGHRLKCWIIPDLGTNEYGLKQTVLSWIEVNLPPEQRPEHLTISPAAPVCRRGIHGNWEITAQKDPSPHRFEPSLNKIRYTRLN